MYWPDILQRPSILAWMGHRNLFPKPIPFKMMLEASFWNDPVPSNRSENSGLMNLIIRSAEIYHKIIVMFAFGEPNSISKGRKLELLQAYRLGCIEFCGACVLNEWRYMWQNLVWDNFIIIKWWGEREPPLTSNHWMLLMFTRKRLIIVNNQSR